MRFDLTGVDALCIQCVMESALNANQTRRLRDWVRVISIDHTDVDIATDLRSSNSGLRSLGSKPKGFCFFEIGGSPMTLEPSSPSPQSACAQSSARTPCRLCSGHAVPMSLRQARLFLLPLIPFRARRGTPPAGLCRARRAAGLRAGLCRVRRGRACGSLLRRCGDVRSQAAALLSSCLSRLRPP